MEVISESRWQVAETNPGHGRGNSTGLREGEGFGLEVLAIYEDLTTALRIKHLLNTLENQLEAKAFFQVNWHRVEMFADAELAETALEEAHQASFVFIALHDVEKMSGPLYSWLFRWLETREYKPCALVVSLDSHELDSLKSNDSFNFLRTVTAQLKVDLFTQSHAPEYYA